MKIRNILLVEISQFFLEKLHIIKSHGLKYVKGKKGVHKFYECFFGIAFVWLKSFNRENLKTDQIYQQYFYNLNKKVKENFIENEGKS